MPGDCIGEKHIFKLGSSPDIMDDEGAEAIGGAFVRYDADMGQGADHLQVPGHEVAGFVIVRVLCDGEGLAVAGEEGLEVRDAAVVDVRIRPFQAPEFGVEAEMGLHVLVDLLLQVDAEGSVGADDDIGADAEIGGDVPAGVGDFEIAAVVGDGGFGLLQGGLCEGFGDNGGVSWAQDYEEKKNKKGAQGHIFPELRMLRVLFLREGEALADRGQGVRREGVLLFFHADIRGDLRDFE